MSAISAATEESVNPTEEGIDQAYWLQYAADVTRSTTRRARQKSYEEMLAQLEPGQVILAMCSLAGASKPFHIFVEDFTAFNWILEKLEEPWDQLEYVGFQPAMLTTMKVMA